VPRYRASLVPADGATTSSARARPTWRETLSDPTVVAVALYSLAVLAAIVAAYLALFSQFAGWDDEGTLLVTVKAFAHGEVLYRDVYSEYGPFYYELFGGLFALTGKAVTTDASRTIVIFLWVGASLFYGIAAQRLTGRLALGLAAMGAAFSVLYVLQAEPMHPQGLCALLLAGFVLLAVLGPSRRPAWIGGAAGAVLGALLLTKINLGGFAIAATVLAGVLAVESLNARRWLVWLAIAGFLAMPIMVLSRDLTEGWTRELMLIELLAMAALVTASWPQLASRPGDPGPTLRWLLGAGAGLILAFAAILVAIFFTGPTPADVYDGVITQALRVRDVLITPLNFPGAAVDWAIATLLASVLVARLRPLAGPGPSIWPGLLRAAAGLTILLVVAHIVPIGFNPTSQNPIVLPMLLAWVAAIPPAGPPEPTYKRFLRVLLPALAVAETLQVYPVSGSQMGISGSVFVPVGALCLGDALVSLRGWGEARGTGVAGRLSVVAAVVAVALAGQFILDSMLRPAVTNAIAYHDREPLPFDGATALRLPPEEVDTYTRLVELLHSHRCTTFIGYPNINSLYLWSGIEPPPPWAPGAWLNALDDEQQQRVIRELRASPRPCAIRSDARAEAWLHGAPPPHNPLVDYVFDDFEPIDEVGEFQFLLPKGSR
jgi:hypothetical protein